MNKISNLLLFLMTLLMSVTASANISHESLNLFSPNSYQENFTLIEPAFIDSKKLFKSSFFLDSSSKSLSLYSKSEVAEAQDLMTFAHLSLSYALGTHFEFGVKAPLLVNQSLPEEQTALSLNLQQSGFTSFSSFLKYNLSGSEKTKVSLLLQIGTDLTDVNYFIGDGPGPSVSAHILLDKKFGRWSTAFNLGYLKRSPGEQEPIRYLFFEPVKSSIQTSLGIGTKVGKKLKLSLEMLYTLNDMLLDQSDRSKQSAEAYLSLRKKFSKVQAVFGLGGGLNKGVSTPECRAFAGLNFQTNFFSRKKFEVSRPPVIEEPVEPIVEIEPEYMQKVNLNYVEFEFNSYRLNQASKNILDKIAKSLISSTYKKIKIIGHADLLGPSRYNEILSLRRAKVIHDYLIFKGLKPMSIDYDAYGKRRPVSGGLNEKSRKLNRRVEIIITR